MNKIFSVKAGSAAGRENRGKTGYQQYAVIFCLHFIMLSYIIISDITL
jgi:hypothetical protein